MTFKTEREFEDALVHLLVTQKGWKGGVLENPSEQDLLDNWAKILFRMNNSRDRLNNVPLNQTEMNQLLHQINNLRSPLLKNDFINGGSVTIKRENPYDKLHLGKDISLKLFDRKEIAGGESNYQIARQPKFIGRDKIKGDNRGDFMFLINGIPVIHVELKKSGVPVSNAVNQIQRYVHNGLFSSGIFSLIQVYVAMTPDEMRYFANPGIDPSSEINHNYVFKWGDFDNVPITDWRKNADTFLSIPMAHQLIGYYTVADKADDTLKVLRSYQIFAVKEIFDRIQQINWHQQHQLGGYIWHTTGSGKTLTSFKAAELIASYGIAEKVIFLMDRIELGSQSLAEFRGFADYAEDIQGTGSTIDLLGKLKSSDSSNILIVTSIQKMSNLNEEDTGIADLDKIRNKRLVIVIDEAHRSTFGDMLITIKKTFPDAIFFGFTGTPIHDENKRKDSTTATIFGNELHRYSLYDGIRDDNVLGFDVSQVETIDYDELRQKVALEEAKASTPEDAYADPVKTEVYSNFLDYKKVPWAGTEDEITGYFTKGIEDYVPRAQFNSDEHRQMVVKDIYRNWVNLSKGGKYSALLAVPTIQEAIDYYRLLKKNDLQLKVTALFDKMLDESAGSIDKEDGLAEIIRDYNRMFDKEYTIPRHGDFKQDISLRLAHKGVYKNLEKKDQLDIVIVVNQLLTGYDSKWINTLYLDKVLEFANIIQAFSRTNRLNGSDKPFGSIRYYRYIHTMQQNIKKAVKLYSGDKEFGLFVDKLGGNLESMNRIIEDIQSVFAVDRIENFEKLPDSVESKKKFASLFQEFDELLEAALIQGFSWDKDSYFTETQADSEKSEIKVLFTEEMYQSWHLRYKELAGPGGDPPGGQVIVPYDLDYTLIQKDTGRIDYEYLNSNFDRYVKLQAGNGDSEEKERVKNDLHRFFSTLSAEQQLYANMVINDLENGDLLVEGDKRFMDYIVAYQERTEDDQIRGITYAFGLDEEQLRSMRHLNISESNINEYGRFNKLKESVDRKQAKGYLSEKLGTKLKPFEVSRKVDSVLRDFLLTDGFDIEEYIVKKQDEPGED